MSWSKWNILSDSAGFTDHLYQISNYLSVCSKFEKHLYVALFAYAAFINSAVLWSWKATSKISFIGNGQKIKSLNSLNPLSANITKWSNTLKHDKLPTNCSSVFDHFVGLALKGLNEGNLKEKTWSRITKNSNKSVRSYVQKLLFLCIFKFILKYEDSGVKHFWFSSSYTHFRVFEHL